METTGRFNLNGIEIDSPIGVVNNVGDSGAFVEASFGVENVQPSIDPLRFTFPNKSAEIIRNYINDGNILKAMPFSAEVVGSAGILQILDGVLDLNDEFENISPVEVSAKVKFKESLLTLEERISSINLDLLYNKKAITDSDFIDVKYVVEKPINIAEIAVISVTLYLMIKELTESVEKIGDDTNLIITFLQGNPPGNVLTSANYLIASVAIRLAYTTVMLATIIDLMIDLLENFISPVRSIKSLNYKNILQKGFQYMGYGFETDIPELDYYTYVPSIKGKPNENGLPNPQDYGYHFGEMVALIRSQFNAKIAIVDNIVQFRSENSSYWDKNSTYTMPDVLLEENNPKGYNTDELVRSRIYKYQLDDLDNWTLDNFKGTTYTVITDHTDQVDDSLNLLTGFEYKNFNVCLGNQKNGLNLLEKGLRTLAKSADIVLSAFNSSKSFVDKVDNRVGMLKVSHEETSKPKCIYYSGGSIPNNHRDITSAKYLYDNYLNYDSFVSNNFKRQRVIYEGVEFGFGLSDFQKTIKNSYFYTNSGKKGKFINIKWDWNSDTVIADFYIEEVYTKKIKEISIERT